MKSYYSSKGISTYVLAFFVLLGIVAVGATTTNAQWRRDDRRYDDRRYDDRDDWRRNRGYDNSYQVARQQGYSYGLSVGASDAQRGQSYKPQRSRYFKDANQGYNSYYGNKGQYKQVFRDAFVQGYREGYQRYAYNNRRSNNGRWGIWRP